MRKAVLLGVIACISLLACDDFERPTDPELPESGHLFRSWRFVSADLGTDTLVFTPWEQVMNGVVSDFHDWGPMVLMPPGTGPNARGEVFSDETGRTFWASTQVPYAEYGDPDGIITTGTELQQGHWYHKQSDDAYLEYVISGVTLDLIDGNPWLPAAQECPYVGLDGWREHCHRMMAAEAFFELWMYGHPNSDGDDCTMYPNAQLRCLFSIGGGVELTGYYGDFRFDASARTRTLHRLWTDDDFVFDPDVDGNQGSHTRVTLREPLRIVVPISRIVTGTNFRIDTTIDVFADNRRQRESYASAYLRDPAEAGGLEIVYSGLTPIAAPSESPPGSILDPAPFCSSEGPLEGVLQFDAAEVVTGEMFREARVRITRTGGSRGAISALLTSRDGTAGAGSDYHAVSTYVLFADGEEGERIAIVPLVSDGEEEPTEHFELTLQRGDGCATIGTQSSTRVTILDDDGPLPEEPTYTIGGTVSGLVGSGLVLTVNSTNEFSPQDGPFVFPREFPDRLPYHVQVATQPSDPAQVCEVVNGDGIIDGADVTDVEVNCREPDGADGLDPSFGVDGKVHVGVPGGARDIAVQDDGRIIAVGGQYVTRYHPDGTLDTSFGAGGQATVDVHGSNDHLEAVAILPDGRILVAGYTRDGANSPTQEDWLLARFAADGSKDTSFGAGGHALVDFGSRGDAAEGILLQGDGSIIVTGTGSVDPTGVSDAEFAAVRFTADGAFDTSFGAAGRATVNIAGYTDLGVASALQPDGRILIAGRAGRTGGSDPDIGIIRLEPDGTLDTSFGSAGIVWQDTDGWDEATGLMLHPDGRITVVGQTGGGPVFLTRYLPDGSPDLSFGNAGRVSEPRIEIARTGALRPDGSIVVGGAENGDYALLRVSPSGEIDEDFGAEGLLIVDFFGGSDDPAALEALPDGSVLAAGMATNGSTRTMGMVKLLP